MLKEEFLTIVRDEMDRQGVSQTELARRMGVPRPMVSRYVSGQQTPGLDVVEKFFVALGIDPTFNRTAKSKQPDSEHRCRTA